MAFIYDLTDTWNAGGTTFNAIKMNVTDTASAAASKLITVQVSGSEKFSVKKDGVGYFAGNVGIGTTSPASGIDVIANSGGYFRGSSAGIIVLDDTGVADASTPMRWMSSDSGSQIFYAANRNASNNRTTGSVEHMRINASGNVGIGTSSPSALLDVAGDAEINGLTVGRGAGDVSTNTASGNQALYSNTTGNNNTASGYQALYSNTTGDNNTASGRGALFFNTEGGSNTASGRDALYSNTTGSNNTAFGIRALRDNTTGNNNTASGYQALYSNTTGNNNTASGYQALQSNTTGNNNTVSGYQTLYSNTEGAQNTASGRDALYFNTTGNNNTASGYQALYNNTTGERNTASGYQVLRLNTTGVRNTAYGYLAGYDNTEGTQNTYIGYNTGRGITTGNYNTIVGADVTGLSASLSNNVIIADGQGNRRINIDSSGRVGIGTTSPESKLDVYNPSGTQGIIVKRSTTTSAAPYMQLQAGAANTRIDATGALVFNTAAIGGSPAERMRIDSSGNVGIGTSSPTSMLHLKGASEPTITLEDTSIPSKVELRALNYGFGVEINDSEALRIDTDGNVGIGTTSPSNRLDVSLEDTTTNRTNPINVTAITATSSAAAGPVYTGFGPALVFRSESYDGTVYAGPRVRMAINDDSISTTAGSSLAFDVTATKGASPTEAMRINPDGSVGIGTTSPDSKLYVRDQVAAAELRIGYNGTSQNYYDANTHFFRTGVGVESMRITSGNLLVGKTAANSASPGCELRPTVAVFTASGSNALSLRRNTSDGGAALFFRDGTNVGSISVTTSATAYNTSSDARLKDNIADAEDAASLIDAIQVRKFDWKADGSHQRYGMIAQELVEVAPEAVSVPQDEDEMMGVDYSKLVPMLVKEIQSLRARVAQLEG
jgi:hypothetical protein